MDSISSTLPKNTDNLSNNSVSLELLDNYVPNPECELAYSEYKFCRERSNYRCDCGVAKQNFLYCEERVKESNSKTI